MNNKLSRKPSYIKQDKLTKDKERQKEKGRSFPVINKYSERYKYNEAVHQKKKMAIICDSMPKWISLSAIKETSEGRGLFTVKVPSE